MVISALVDRRKSKHAPPRFPHDEPAPEEVPIHPAGEAAAITARVDVVPEVERLGQPLEVLGRGRRKLGLGDRGCRGEEQGSEDGERHAGTQVHGTDYRSPGGRAPRSISSPRRPRPGSATAASGRAANTRLPWMRRAENAAPRS